MDAICEYFVCCYLVTIIAFALSLNQTGGWIIGAIILLLSYLIYSSGGCFSQVTLSFSSSVLAIVIFCAMIIWLAFRLSCSIKKQ